MKRQIRFILFLFIVSLIACQKQSHILPLLQEAETLMDSRPDSSLCLLESVQSPENLSAAEYATWCLLVTQAIGSFVTKCAVSIAKSQIEIVPLLW